MRSRICMADDRGVAMLTVVLVGAIMTALGIAVTKVSIVNLDNAGRDRVASGALGAAEAGVAGAITYIRSSGVRQICNDPAVCTTLWNVGAPRTLMYAGAGTAVVTIKELARYNPAAGNKVGRYLIRSVGTSGSGPGRRTIEQAIDVKPFDFPLGIYTQAKINLGGNVTVQRESVFSGSCIDSRDKLLFQADPADGKFNDPYNDIPAGAHSVSYITNGNESVCSSNLSQVKSNDVKAIHRASTCNTTWWADQDGAPLGGAFSGTSGDFCRNKTVGKGDYDSKGSEFSLDTLRNTYGFKPRGLTDEQYALLKSKAKANGTWFPAGVTPVFPTASYNPGDPGFNPIIYIEDQNVSLTNQLNSYAWQPDPACTGLHPSVLLVVERGSLNQGSGSSVTGNLFVPDGEIAFAGGSNLLGTLFSKELKFVGSGNVGLNDCVVQNTNGGILSITKTRFREIDR